MCHNSFPVETVELSFDFLETYPSYYNRKNDTFWDKNLGHQQHKYGVFLAFQAKF